MNVSNVDAARLIETNTITFQNGHFDKFIHDDLMSKSWTVWVMWYSNAIWVNISDKNRYINDNESNPQLPPSFHPIVYKGNMIKHRYRV